MIRIQSVGGPDAIGVQPVFVCDICGKPITKIEGGVAVIRDVGKGKGELDEVLHAHKKTCMRKAEARLQGKRAVPGPWYELEAHLNDLAMGVGATIQSMVYYEATLKPILKPAEDVELRKRLTDLGNWLREHGVSAPLWK